MIQVFLLVLILAFNVQAKAPPSSGGDTLKFSKKYSLDLSRIRAKDRENQSDADIGRSWSIQRKQGDITCTLSILDSQDPRHEELPKPFPIEVGKWTTDALQPSANTKNHTLLFQWISESGEVQKRMKKSGQVANFLSSQDQLNINLACDSFSEKLPAEKVLPELVKKLKATGLDAFVQIKGL